jgi:hypothetical protein
VAISERLALLVTLDAKGAVKSFNDLGNAADKNLAKADQKLDKMASRFQKAGAGMLATAGIAAVGLFKAGEAAADLGEEISQSEVIFGSASDSIESFAKSAAGSLGQSELSARAAANTFGLFFTNAGKSADEAAAMSIELSTLASDMASFKNTRPEEAVEALGAALRGESEPIRRFGVMLDDATLKQRALSMGLIDTTTGTLPPAIKMQAAYAEILEQTSTIQGDFARTSESASNQMRIANAEMANAKASLGESVAPIIADLAGGLADVAGGFTRANEASGGFLSKAATVGTVALAAAGGISFAVGKLIDMRETIAPLGGRIRNLDGSFTKLGRTLGGIGIAGTVVGLVQMARAADAVQIDVDKVAASIADLTAAEEAAMGKRLLFLDSWGDLDNLVRETAASNVIAAERIIDVAEAGGLAADKVKALRDIVDSKRESDVQGAKDQQEYATQVDAAVGPTENLTGKLDEQKTALDLATESTNLFKEGLDKAFGDLTLEEAADRRAKAFTDMAEQFADAQENVKSAKQRVADLLATPVEDRSDTFAEDLAAAQREVQEAIDETSRRLDGNSEAALRNRENIRGAVDEIAAVIQAHRDEGASLEELQFIRGVEKANLEDQLEQLGFNKEEIRRYIEAIDAIPITKETTITADTAPALLRIQELTALVAKIDPAKIDVSLDAQMALQRAQAGQRRAIGGPVTAGERYSVNEYLGAGKGYEWFAPANGTISPAPASGTVVEQTNNFYNPAPEPASTSARHLRVRALDMAS